MPTLLLMPTDLVDALSAPIQFMTQAEKRTKQLQEMGVDENDIKDISDIPTTSKKVTSKDQIPANGKVMNTSAPPAQRSNSSSSTMLNSVNVDRKKGIFTFQFS